MNKKLNLKYINEIIKDDYKNWNNGDVILLSAQTGAGKTLFVTGNKEIEGLCDNLKNNEKLIYICNRVELKRQLKLDLLKKYNLEIKYVNDKVDFKWLDKKTVIGNITVLSYHTISEKKLDEIYSNGKKIDLDLYKYIICDECHFFFTDSNFNNKTFIAFEELVRHNNPNSIKIFISATVEEIKNSIVISPRKGKLIEYDTNRDYSYLDTKYFKDLKDIIQLVKNDKSEDKWLIFVTNKTKGNMLLQELNKLNISATFIKSGVENKEKKLIVETSSFKSKVLISTKVLDNGVNIKDDKVNNLVIMAHDKTTFLQEVGRVRIDIKNARNINLYIPKFYKKTFLSKLKNGYKKKSSDLELYLKDYNGFCRKYDVNSKDIEQDMFSSILNQNEKWCLNGLGYARFVKDYNFSMYMVDKFENDDFAYIKEQLSWLGLEHTFNINSMIESVIDDEDIKNLEGYLENCFVNKIIFLKSDDRIELIEKIGLVDKNNSNFKKDKIVYIKNIDTLNSYLIEELKLPYTIRQFETSRIVDGKKKKYKQAWKIVKIIG